MHISKRHQGRLIAALLVIIALLVCFIGAELRVPADTQAQSADSIKTAVESSAVQCFAIEGAYPSSLTYLEQRYGLQVNHDEYYVTYTCFASNVMPTVEVLSREN